MSIAGRRTLLVDPQLDTREGYSSGDEVRPARNEWEANLVSSKTKSGKHAPALDIDVPARLIPSSQQGHSHLYIDVELTWRQYRRLLRALAKAGIIERGYMKASLARGASFLRPPGKSKPGYSEASARFARHVLDLADVMDVGVQTGSVGCQSVLTISGARQFDRKGSRDWSEL